jgi:Prealbumin-like fold domain
MTPRVLGPSSSPRRRWTLLVPLTLVLGFGLMYIAGATGAPSNPAASLEQCRNGSADSPRDCNTGSPNPDASGSTGWANGNAGPENAHFMEGYSIPYRAILTNLPTDGTVITLVMEYDLTASSLNGGTSVKALDFLTDYDRLQPHLGFGHVQEAINPTNGVSGIAAGSDTEPIPQPTDTGSINPQLAASWNAVPASEKDMELFGGDISDVDYVVQGDIDAAGAKTQISIEFTADSSTAVLAWGGHIARAKEYGAGFSASGISGSPYHMRTIGWNLNNLGSQDRSLKASAVFPTGTIIVEKACGGQSGGPFGFTTTGTGFAGFNLNCGGSTTVEGVLALGTPGFGTYTVEESSLPSGWQLLSSQIVSETGGTGTTTASTCNATDAEKQCTIKLDANETVTVRFTNEGKGAILINKNSSKGTGTSPVTVAGALFSVDGPDAGTTADFTVRDNNVGTPAGSKSDEDSTIGVICVSGLELGSYTVNETSPPSGYEGAGQTNVAATVVVGTDCGSNKPTSGIATFTNDPLAEIQVNFKDLGSGETNVAGTTITCAEGAMTLTPSSTTPPSGWHKSATHTNLDPGTYVCTVVIDP